MKRKTYTATILFFVGLLLAGLANAFARVAVKEYIENLDSPTGLPFLSTVLFCLNLAIYLLLLLFWIRSTRHRLLPSKERTYLIAAAVCAVTMLVLRTAKYRIIHEYSYTQLRYAWYAYYIPTILMPTFFLMTCILIEGKNRKKRFDERFLLIPAFVLILLFLTNDLHHLAFRPLPMSTMTGANGTYTKFILPYVYYGYYAVTVGAGLFLLTRANRRLHSLRKAALPFLFLFVMLGLYALDKAMNIVRLPSMYTLPESISFGMVGIFESCIRNRLIPYNDNYSGFFETMPFPVMITERDLSVVYRTASPVKATPEQLTASLEGPVFPDPDTKLSGRTLRSGYAFYSEDVGELNRLNEKLEEANELLSSENDLIQAENDLKKRRAEVDSRNLIYSRISERMYPYHRRAQELLDSAEPDTPSFRASVARLNILNAYIKRGTNLLLADAGADEIDVRELKLALEESARYLHYCGIEAQVVVSQDGRLPREIALALYTAFEEVAEALIGTATLLNISLTDRELRLIADCAAVPEFSPTGLPVDVRESDGLYFFIISSENGGAV